jgi:hypothetical protein
VEPVENASTALTTKLRAVRKRLADPSEALIPSKGGAGGYGQGLQVMKARNAGEAKWAKNMAKQNREWRAREAHKTRIGFVHNSQKREFCLCDRERSVTSLRVFGSLTSVARPALGTDFRDPLLQ